MNHRLPGRRGDACRKPKTACQVHYSDAPLNQLLYVSTRLCLQHFFFTRSHFTSRASSFSEHVCVLALLSANLHLRPPKLKLLKIQNERLVTQRYHTIIPPRLRAPSSQNLHFPFTLSNSNSFLDFTCMAVSAGPFSLKTTDAIED